MPRYLFFYLLPFTFCLLSACHNAPPPRANNVIPGFPVARYLAEQYKIYRGRPYPLYCIVTINGKTDTAITNFLHLDFEAIAALFGAGDISDTTFLGKYEVSEFDDDVSGNHTYQYAALDKKLRNQMTIVSLDAENKRPAMLYQKNVTGSRSGRRIQQLTYIPRSYIQILEDDAAKPGEARTLKIEYRFLQGEE